MFAKLKVFNWDTDIRLDNSYTRKYSRTNRICSRITKDPESKAYYMYIYSHFGELIPDGYIKIHDSLESAAIQADLYLINELDIEVDSPFFI